MRNYFLPIELPKRLPCVLLQATLFTPGDTRTTNWEPLIYRVSTSQILLEPSQENDFFTSFCKCPKVGYGENNKFHNIFLLKLLDMTV